MPLSQPLRLGFLASHGGSGMRAIVEAIQAGRLDAEPRLLISNNHGSPALDYARSQGIAHRHISTATEAGAEAVDDAIVAALEAAGVELVVLSGYMRKLGHKTLKRFRNRILNIHPALLPRHGGQGMYGRRVHEAVHAAGDAVSGATVHLVDSDYDTGPVIARQEAPLEPGGTADDIERKVRAVEGPLYVRTLQDIADGRIALPDP